MRDLTPCADCETAAWEHFGDGLCRGFVPPLPSPVAALLGNVAEAVLGRLCRFLERRQ